jgi:hypothetical protein
MNRINLGVGNYYGDVEAVELDGKYYLILDNWDQHDMKEISKEFYDAIIKEFVK